jgi:hypothetical protein
MIDVLRKHMNFMTRRQMLDQRHRITLCSTTSCAKLAIQHGNTKATLTHLDLRRSS